MKYELYNAKSAYNYSYKNFDAAKTKEIISGINEAVTSGELTFRTLINHSIQELYDYKWLEKLGYKCIILSHDDRKTLEISWHNTN